jgi:hypothetical protein
VRALTRWQAYGLKPALRYPVGNRLGPALQIPQVAASRLPDLNNSLQLHFSWSV